MTNSIYQQAKEIQQLAGKFLCEEVGTPYTDIEEWKEVQKHLATCIEEVLKQEGSTPEEEGEILLAVLMGYTVAVRKQKNIAIAMERANWVLKELQDPLLKCKLAVLCYGECYDEDLADMARRLIEEQKQVGNEKAVYATEVLLMSMEENKVALSS